MTQIGRIYSKQESVRGKQPSNLMKIVKISQLKNPQVKSFNYINFKQAQK